MAPAQAPPLGRPPGQPQVEILQESAEPFRLVGLALDLEPVKNDLPDPLPGGDGPAGQAPGTPRPP